MKSIYIRFIKIDMGSATEILRRKEDINGHEYFTYAVAIGDGEIWVAPQQRILRCVVDLMLSENGWESH